jgi:hypothetical protein
MPYWASGGMPPLVRNARLVQVECERQPADAPADNDDRLYDAALP